jgi:4-amino-4-deoxy-L-arabinose transferase-like glycosyltransferase
VSDRAPIDSLARWIYGGLAVLVAVLWLANLNSRPLFNPDEGRYAEIPREMLAGGGWIIPHLNGLAYIEKPPLQYWATAAALRVFGQGVFAARLYTALCALGTLSVMWWVARRMWGSAAAWRGGAMLAGMMLFVVMGQLLTLDMSLTFYMTLGLGAFLLAQQAPLPPDPRSHALRWMVVAWGGIALGVLTKGLVAAAIPAAVLVLYSLYSRDYSPWRRLYAWVGLPLFLAISVPWHWLAQRRMGDFAEFFFVHEHVARYLTPSAHREEPWWYFGAVFLLGSLPFSVSALRAVATRWRRRGARGQFDPTLFLWVWVVFVCVFFSLSDSKLIPYILPAMPALALLIAGAPADARRRDAVITALLTLGIAIGLAWASYYLPRFIAPTERGSYFALLARPLMEVAAVLGAAGLLVLLQRHREGARAAVVLGVGWCLSGMLLMRAAALVAPIYSGTVLAAAGSGIPRDQPIYSVATYDQSLPFYWQRTMTLVAYRGELDFGLNHNPGAEIPTVAQFIPEWRGLSDGYAVMERSMFDELKTQGVPMREMARDLNRVLVARR